MDRQTRMYDNFDRVEQRTIDSQGFRAIHDSLRKMQLTIPIIMIIGIVVRLPYAFTDTYCCIVPYH